MDVDSIRQGLEAYRNELELDRYELDRGLRKESRAGEVRRRAQELFESDAREIVASATKRAEKQGLEADAHSLSLLHSGLVRLHVQRELAPIDAAIERHGRVVKIGLTDGTTRRLRDMKLLLSSAEDGEKRQEIEEARVEQARILIPLMAEKVAIEQGIAQSLGFRHLGDLFAQIGQVDLEQVAGFARSLLDDTADLYREVMGWAVRKRLGIALEDAHRCDIPYVLAGRYRDYEDAFTAADMVRRTKDFLRRMGVDLFADGRLKVETEAAEPPRAYTAAVQVPNDIRLVLEIKDGQRDWLTFLESLGRAQFLAHIDADLPFEQRGLGDGALNLAYGALFRHLLLDREFLKHALEFSRPKDYLLQAWVERLYDVRLACGRALFELELRQRCSAEGMEDVFEATMREAIGVSTPRELFLHDVRSGLHSVIQLRARLLEPLLTLHLVHYFDETWWKNPRTGPFLTRQWSNGYRFGAEALATEVGAELTPKPLLKLFLKNL